MQGKYLLRGLVSTTLAVGMTSTSIAAPTAATDTGSANSPRTAGCLAPTAPYDSSNTMTSSVLTWDIVGR